MANAPMAGANPTSLNLGLDRRRPAFLDNLAARRTRQDAKKGRRTSAGTKIGGSKRDRESCVVPIFEHKDGHYANC